MSVLFPDWLGRGTNTVSCCSTQSSNTETFQTDSRAGTSMSFSGGRAVQLLRSVSAPTRPQLGAWPVLRAWRHIQTARLHPLTSWQLGTLLFVLFYLLFHPSLWIDDTELSPQQREGPAGWAGSAALPEGPGARQVPQARPVLRGGDGVICCVYCLLLIRNTRFWDQTSTCHWRLEPGS